MKNHPLAALRSVGLPALDFYYLILIMHLAVHASIGRTYGPRLEARSIPAWVEPHVQKHDHIPRAGSPIYSSVGGAPRTKT
jgi:hypothetical protein